MIRIDITDTGVSQAVERLAQALGSPQSALKEIGSLVQDFTRQRFWLRQDPYGTRWLPNKPSTIEAYVRRGFGYGTKGALNRRGAALLASKRPLIGQSKSLSTQIHYQVLGAAVEVRSSMAYAAMQQFGGSKAKFPQLWGDIPARPFFPDPQRGLPAPLTQRIHDVLAEALLGAARNPA